MRMPKAILFDLDDTIIDRDATLVRYAGRFIRDFGGALQPSCTLERLASIVAELDAKGYKPRETFLADMRDAVPWLTSPAAIEALRAHWFAHSPGASVVAEGAMEAIDRLRARGIALGIVTNGAATTQEAKIDIIGIRPRLTTVVVSETAGLRKPDAGIFEAALKRIGARAEETWFVGDHPVNDVLGAAGAGLTPVWLRGKQPWPDGVPQPALQIDRWEQLTELLAARERIAPRPALSALEPYVPGKPIAEVQRTFGLRRVVKLASNENPLGPSPKAIKEATRLLAEAHRYPDGSSDALRRAIAAHYGVFPGEVIAGNGADELIKLVSEAYLEPGDEIVAPSPTFSEYAFGAKLMGANVVSAPLSAPDYAYDVDALLRAVTTRTKLVYVCSPNNPTGTYATNRMIGELLEALPDGALLVLDAAYSHYAAAGDYADGVEWLKRGASILILSTFSKAYGLAGLRVGFGLAPVSVVETIGKVREPFHVNAIAQAAAAAALHDTEHVDRSVRLVRAGRERLYRMFDAFGLPYTPSESNFVLVDAGERAYRLYERLLERGVIVRHGAIWGLPRKLRITVGTDEEHDVLEEALRAALADIRPTAT